MLTHWKKHLRLRPRLRGVEQDLAEHLGVAVRLHAVSIGGAGKDSVYQAVYHNSANGGHRRTARTLASVRIGSLTGVVMADEPELPRQLLPLSERLMREARCYSRLAPEGLTPELLVRGDGYLANEWLPWPRAAEVLRKSELALWKIAPLVLQAIRRMHQLDGLHLDLNAGNILLHPSLNSLALVDFEYCGIPDVHPETLQAFDYLRLIHGFLKPRRGLSVIRNYPERLAAVLLDYLPVTTGARLSELHHSCFRRVRHFRPICQAFESRFGEIPCFT